MHDLTRLTACELAERLATRELRAVDVTEACLACIAAREPAVHAWAAIDPEHARAQARALDAGPIRGPLHGLPVGVKDILDTADLPTEYGSAIYRGRRPAADAACVAAARAAGAVVLGKTATTEFACMSPASTVNPLNPAHTPGGSSSGTAAGVADWMMPFGFGTQTAGSIVRPASFCGLVGYKPTFGTVNRRGLKQIAGSLDTIGALARTVADAALLVGAVAGRGDLIGLPSLDTAPGIGLCRTHDWDAAMPDMAAAVEAAGAALAAAGARVTDVDLPDEFAGLGEAHATIQGYEAVRTLAAELRDHRDALSEPLRDMLDEGGRVSDAGYARAVALAERCRSPLAGVFGTHDVLLAPGATGEAPRSLASTGSPVMNRVWTLLHVPCVGIPGGRGAHGLPLGLQAIGRPGDDARMLAAADWIGQGLGT